MSDEQSRTVDVQRWMQTLACTMRPFSSGDWVKYEDYLSTKTALARTLGAILDRIDMAPNDDPLPYIREYVERLQEEGGLL